MADERLAAARAFTYDSINRLTASTGGPSGSISYTLDGVGNREEVTGGAHAGEYTMSSSTPNPADFQMNQYTTAPFGGLPSVSRTHDLKGNATLIPFQEDAETTPVTATAIYDYRNLMVEYEREGMTAEYKYDALGRRIEKTLTDGEDTTTTLYLYKSLQIVEETDGEGATGASYLYGIGVDEPLILRLNGDDYFYHSDEQGTIWAITDAAGVVKERYNYEDFGEAHVFDSSDAFLEESSVRNPYRYTGRSVDSESDLYWYRTRYYHPIDGRFSCRDPIGVWGDSGNLGNVYAYVGNAPWNRVDPYGMMPFHTFTEPHGQDPEAREDRKKFRECWERWKKQCDLPQPLGVYWACRDCPDQFQHELKRCKFKPKKCKYKLKHTFTHDEGVLECPDGHDVVCGDYDVWPTQFPSPYCSSELQI